MSEVIEYSKRPVFKPLSHEIFKKTDKEKGKLMALKYSNKEARKREYGPIEYKKHLNIARYSIEPIKMKS